MLDTTEIMLTFMRSLDTFLTVTAKQLKINNHLHNNFSLTG